MERRGYYLHDRRRRADRPLLLAMAIGGLAGIPLALLTLNLGWVAGRIVDLTTLLR